MQRRYALPILIICCIVTVFLTKQIDYTDIPKISEDTISATSTTQEDYIEKLNKPPHKIVQYTYTINYNEEYSYVPISDAYYLFDTELKLYVKEVAEMYSIEPSLIYAVIQVESNFDLNAFRDGCVGLMQISMGNNAWLQREAGVKDLSDPYDNIRGGCYILHHFLEQGYTIEQALVAYNVGHVSTNSSVYSRKVIASANEYHKLLKNYTEFNYTR